MTGELNEQTMPVLLIGGRYDGMTVNVTPESQVIDITHSDAVIVPEQVKAEREEDSSRYYIYPLHIPALDLPLVFFVGVSEGQPLSWAVASVMAFYAHKHSSNETEGLN